MGIRFCTGSSPIRRLLSRGLVLGFGLAAYQALLPAVVSDRLQGDEIDFGMMLGSFGVGSIVAAPFIGTVRRRLGLEGILIAGALTFVVVMSVLAEADTMVQALPAAFLGGTAWVAVLTSLNTAIQMRSPDEILGRCLSIYQAVTFGGMAVGSWAWGAIADVRSLAFALHGGSIFLVAMFVVLRLAAPLPKSEEGLVDAW